MVKTVLQFLLISIFFIVLIAFESVIGLPVLFFVVVGLLSTIVSQLLWWPILLLLVLSLVLATAFQMPMYLSFLLLVGLVYFNSKEVSLITRRSIRIILGTILGVVVVLAFAPIRLADIGFWIPLFQFIAALIIIWRIVGIPIVTDRGLIKRLGRQ